MDAGDDLGVEPGVLGDLDDVQQQERAEQLGQPQRQPLGQPQLDEPGGIGAQRLPLGPAQQVGRARAEPGHRRAEALDLGGDVGEREADVDEPARRAIDEPTDLGVRRVLRTRRHHVVERLDVGPQRRQVEHRAHDAVGAGHVRDVDARLLDGTVHERRPAPVDHVVDEDGGDDLAVQRVAAQLIGEPLGDRRREVPGEDAAEVRLVGQRGVLDVLCQRHLRVRDQHRVLGRDEPDPLGRTSGQLGVGRQELQRAVELPGSLEHLHEPLVDTDEVRAQHARHTQKYVLLVVVAQHVRGDVGGGRREQLVALVAGDRAGGDGAVEQDLDVDLVVGGVDAR